MVRIQIFLFLISNLISLSFRLGYADIIAKVDISTYRRIPWENNIPFFLLSFYDPVTKEPLYICPRGLLKNICIKYEALGKKFYFYDAFADLI